MTRQFVFVILLLVGVSVIDENYTVLAHGNFQKSRPFRYAIVHDRIDPSLGKDDPERRFIEVLISKKSFSKSNLIELADLLCKRFPKPTLLYISIFTDLEDVQTPEERDEPLISNNHPSGPTPKDRAKIVRRNDGSKKMTMVFGTSGNETVEIK